MEKFIQEKDFFDVGTDEPNQDNQSNDLQDEAIKTSDILKLKILWSHLVYLYRVVRKLSVLNDAFEENFEEFQELFRVFRDFVINYEDYNDQTRKAFIDTFRKGFIDAIKHLKQTIISLGG